MRSAFAFPRTVEQSVGLFSKTTSLAKQFVEGLILDAVDGDCAPLRFRERLGVATTDDPLEEAMGLNEATVPPPRCLCELPNRNME